MSTLNKNVEFLLKVLDKPGMFLINSIDDYYLFYQGFICGLSPDSVSELHRFFDLYSGFVANRLGVNENAPWYKVISFKSSTGIESLRLGKKYLDEFYSSREL